MHPKSGFTLIETLISLMISTLVIFGFLRLFETLERFNDTLVERQNALGILQLRQVLSLGQDFEVLGDEICMEYQTTQTCFYETNNHLIQVPGPQIFLIEISDLEFSNTQNILSISYFSLGKEYNKQLIVIRN